MKIVRRKNKTFCKIFFRKIYIFITGQLVIKKRNFCPLHMRQSTNYLKLLCTLLRFFINLHRITDHGNEDEQIIFTLIRSKHKEFKKGITLKVNLIEPLILDLDRVKKT